MKRKFRLLTVISLSALILVSCSKEDDPKDNDLFVGTYKGAISYNDNEGTRIVKKDGKVIVGKIGDTYNFDFSDAIPSIKNVKIEKGKGKFDIGLQSSKIITIDAHKLHIAVTEGKKIWTADCER